MLSSFLGRGRQFKAEVAWVVAGQVVAALCALVGMRYLTRQMSPSEYGVLALALTVGALMQQLVFGPVSNAVLRFYSASATRGQLRPMLRGAARLFSGASLALAACTVVAIVARENTSVKGGGMLIAMASAFAFVLGANGVLAAAHSAARRRGVVAAHQALAEFLRFSVALIAIRLAGASSLSAITGFVIGIGLCASSQFALLFRVLRREPPDVEPTPEVTSSPVGWTRQLRGYAMPFALWGGFTWAVLASDRWSLQAFQNTAEVGRYAALFQLGSYPVTMGASMLVQLAAPVLFARAADASDAGRRNNSRRLNFLLTGLVLAGTVVATLAAELLHRQVFSLLVGEAYRSVSWLLPAVVFGAGLFAAGQQLALTLQSDMRVHRLLMPKIGSAVAGMGLYFGGSRWWGTPGVVIAGVLFSLLHLLWIALACRVSELPSSAAVAVPYRDTVPQ